MIYTDAKGEVVLDEAAALGDGAKYYANAAGDGIFVVMPPALDETCLKNIETSFSQGTGAPIYIMTFKKPCAETLGEVTGKNVGKQMAIIINGTLISAPIIQEAITGGSLVIEGGA